MKKIYVDECLAKKINNYFEHNNLQCNLKFKTIKMKAMEELRQWIIKCLPDSGEWWDESNADAFINHAEYLHYNTNLENHEIKEILSEFYSSVSAEYGN